MSAYEYGWRGPRLGPRFRAQDPGFAKRFRSAVEDGLTARELSERFSISWTMARDLATEVRKAAA